MRSIKELLEILLDQYENNKDDTVRSEGICKAINRLYAHHGIFTKEEKERLDVFIYDHRPDLNSNENDFWWDMGIIYPRVEFLTRLISRL